MTAQLDLFGEVEAAEQASARASEGRSRAANTFLASPWPDLLGWWGYPDVVEAQLHHGETEASKRSGPNGTPGWAWATWRDGLHFEGEACWSKAGGWSHRPSWVIPWTELHALRDSRPDITQRILDLADGHGAVRRGYGWRWWAAPYTLTPWGWHPSYYEVEQQADYYDHDARPEGAWADRMAAWRLVLDAVTVARLTVIEA